MVYRWPTIVIHFGTNRRRDGDIYVFQGRQRQNFASLLGTTLADQHCDRINTLHNCIATDAAAFLIVRPLNTSHLNIGPFSVLSVAQRLSLSLALESSIADKGEGPCIPVTAFCSNLYVLSQAVSFLCLCTV